MYRNRGLSPISPLDELEKKIATHDQAIAGLIDAIRQLMAPPETKKRPIGFVPPQENKSTKPGNKRGG